MSTRAMARFAVLACVMAFMAAPSHANEGAHAVAERFAGEAERSEAAKAEDARKREAELKADKERQEAAARRAAEALKADKERAEKARRAKAGRPEPARTATPDRRKSDEDEMLSRAKREAEEMQAAEEARILAEQDAAMQRAKKELEASQAAEQDRAKADAQRREATRGKDAGTAQAEKERARLEELAREAARAQQAETARAAEERAKAEALVREAEERVKQAEAEARASAAAAARARAEADRLAKVEAERLAQAEAEARARTEAAARAQAERLAKAEAERLAQAEADRVAVEWTRRAVANRQAMQKLGRMRDIREARLAAQAQRAEAERQVAEARRKVEEEQRAMAPENRRPELAEAPRPERVERTEGSARETAGRGEIDLSELRLPKLGGPDPRMPDTHERASRERDVPDWQVDSGVPGERRVTVLLVMAPGNYGIRRNGPKVADPILCTLAGCYVSMGPDTPARFLPGRKATGVGNTLGGRAGACRRSLSCIFRGIDIDERGSHLQPVDMHVFKHDRRRPQVIDRDSDCRVADGRLSCRRGIYAEDYAMWVIPERMAAEVSLGVLQRALDEGLAAPRSADLQPRW